MRIIAIHAVTNLPFADAATSASVSSVCTITPARLDGDGSAQPLGDKQKADGVLIRRKLRSNAPGGAEGYVWQAAFIPWNNLKGIIYEAEKADK